MKVKEASKYLSLEKLYTIRENQYRGTNGAEYYPDTVDSLIWKKESEKDNKNMIQALQEMDKFEIITVGR